MASIRSHTAEKRTLWLVQVAIERSVKFLNEAVGHGFFAKSEMLLRVDVLCRGKLRRGGRSGSPKT